MYWERGGGGDEGGGFKPSRRLTDRLQSAHSTSIASPKHTPKTKQLYCYTESPRRFVERISACATVTTPHPILAPQLTHNTPAHIASLRRRRKLAWRSRAARGASA